MSASATSAPSSASTVDAAALAIAAVVMLVPAYALPVMHLGLVGHLPSDTTIFSGVIQLWQQGLVPLAVIVFTASFLVPLLKLAGLSWLLVSAWRRREDRARRLTKVYAAIEFIGRWSMLDVFLVAFLSGAVRFGKLSTIQPRAGVLAFASVVVLTMLATRRFDPRVLWLHVRPSLAKPANPA